MGFWDYPLLNFSTYIITPIDLVEVLLIWVIARLILWLLTRVLLGRIFKRNNVDSGRQFAVIQLIKYIIYTFAFVSIFQALGFSFSLIWAGSAALLVGVGLGLQQTFNDLFSGLVLLGEGTVEVDDILEVEGTIGRVVSIGLRTSKMVTRDRIDLIIPNSILVTEKVVNWSHFQSSTRFEVKVGVAYGSDIELVQRLLMQSVEEVEGVMKNPKAQVQLQAFGDSSLDFGLYFFSKDFWRIEFIKSNIRLRILTLFEEHDIEIPFPQRVTWSHDVIK